MTSNVSLPPPQLLCYQTLQALQQLFKQEVTSGRARCLQLQDVLHQRSTDLEAARLQLTAAQQQRAGAEAKQRQLQLQLEGAQRGSQLLQQQVDKVGLGVELARF